MRRRVADSEADAIAIHHACWAELVKQAKQKPKQAFIYINNRLEGNALETIAAMVEVGIQSRDAVEADPLTE